MPLNIQLKGCVQEWGKVHFFHFEKKRVLSKNRYCFYFQILIAMYE